jgi:hypothetical protein
LDGTLVADVRAMSPEGIMIHESTARVRREQALWVKLFDLNAQHERGEIEDSEFLEAEIALVQELSELRALLESQGFRLLDPRF